MLTEPAYREACENEGVVVDWEAVRRIAEEVKKDHGLLRVRRVKWTLDYPYYGASLTKLYVRYKSSSYLIIFAAFSSTKLPSICYLR
ncbi:hypothetical protein CPB85DRAFT_958402 [Mucidula mucida]|nr:hypothetical protein CPB85DRAFT_958402 [Mucidula mucida]